MTVPGAGVEVCGVSKAFGFDGHRVAVLEDVSLTIGMGEFVSVIGPSGCGKSTLLKIVAGLLDADQGSVTIDGESVSAASAEKKIGLVPQSPALLPWRTVLENVRLPLNVNRRANHGRSMGDAEGLLSAFGLGAAMGKYPWQLSGGMQQRASIVRSLAVNPSVLLMDEPFGALDAFTRDEMNLLIQEIWMETRKTIVFVTHSISEAIFLADRVVVMSARPGRVASIYNIDIPRPRPVHIQTRPDFIERILTIKAKIDHGRGAAIGVAIT